VRLVVRQLGPGMIQQMQMQCDGCNGKGDLIKEDDKCKECKGKKTKKEKKILHVYVDKGMRHGQKVTFQGEADEAPGLETGDIIFVLNEQQHPIFKRSGNDLVMEVHIPLVEALCGFKLVIPHLDKRELLVQVGPGEIITPGEIRSINGEGMPVHKHPEEKGSLYIKFQVDFPKSGSLSPSVIKTLEEILPGKRPAPVETEDMEHVTLSSPVTAQERSDRNRRRADEEDEGQTGGSRVQCAQQ